MASRKDRSRRRFVTFRGVQPGWTALLVPIPVAVVFGIGSYTGDVLPWLNLQFSLGWLVLLAITIVGFSGAYAATEPGPPLEAQIRRPPVIRRLGGARMLALAALFFCVYLVSVLSWYIADPSASRFAGQLTWWGVPFAVCFWTLAAVEIANETERSGSGEPADPERQWTWLAALRRSPWAQRTAYVVLFGGTIAVAAVGSVPGVVWRRGHDGEMPAWRGHGYVTTAVYDYGVTVWAGALLIAATVFLGHAFRARPLGLPAAVLRRSWYALWASGAVVVLMACFGLAAHGVLSEPLIDLAVALYALCFAVMLVDASATTKHRRVKSSLPRRVIGAITVIGFAFGLALIVAPALSLFRLGLLSLAVAAVFPLFRAILRTLFGIDRQPPPSAFLDDATEVASNRLLVPLPTEPDQRAAVYSVLLGLQPDILPAREVLGHWRRSLLALQTVSLPSATNAPTKHPLMFLLFTCDDGLERTKTYAPPEDLVVLLELLFEGDLDDQKHELIDLMRRSALELDGTPLDTVGPPNAPRAMEMLEAECVARYPRLPDDPVERTHWLRLRAMRREWLFGDVAVWTGTLQPVESTRQGMYRKSHGAIRSQLLAKACESVLVWWLANLEAALIAAAALSADAPHDEPA